MGTCLPINKVVNEGSTVVSVIRAYVDGTEINKVPELAEICTKADWLNDLLRWAHDTRKATKMDAIFLPESEDLLLAELWIGGAPPMRAMELGGVLKTYVGVNMSVPGRPRI